jgi:hypothetical protein
MRRERVGVIGAAVRSDLACRIVAEPQRQVVGRPAEILRRVYKKEAATINRDSLSF